MSDLQDAPERIREQGRASRTERGPADGRLRVEPLLAWARHASKIQVRVLDCAIRRTTATSWFSAGKETQWYKPR